MAYDFEKLTTMSSHLTTFLESLMKCRLGPTISYNGNGGDTVLRTKELFHFESTFPNVLLHYTFRGSPIYINFERADLPGDTSNHEPAYRVHASIGVSTERLNYIETEFMLPCTDAFKIFYCVIYNTLDSLDDKEAKFYDAHGPFTDMTIDESFYEIDDLVEAYYDYVGSNQVIALINDPSNDVVGFTITHTIGGSDQINKITVKKNLDKENSYQMIARMAYERGYDFLKYKRDDDMFARGVDHIYTSIMRLKKYGIVTNLEMEFIYKD